MTKQGLLSSFLKSLRAYMYTTLLQQISAPIKFQNYIINLEGNILN